MNQTTPITVTAPEMTPVDQRPALGERRRSTINDGKTTAMIVN
jgi:hypothetical protein